MPSDSGGAATALGYLASRRERIAAALASLAERRGSELERAPGGGRAALDRILEYCLRGKMIRGSLVYLGLESAAAGGAAAASAADSVALAMELFQAGLLVHDDIMDRDETRRGAPSIHALYAGEARAEGAIDGLHVGEALGICSGDLCYFEAFAELSRSLGFRLDEDIAEAGYDDVDQCHHANSNEHLRQPRNRQPDRPERWG